MIKINITKNNNEIKITREENLIVITEENNVIKSHDIFENLFKVDTIGETFKLEERCDVELSTKKLNAYYNDILEIINSVIKEINELSENKTEI